MLGLDVLAKELGATRPQADPYDEQLAPDHGLRRADHAGEQAGEAALVLDVDDDRQRFPAEAVTQLRCLAASNPSACTIRSFGETRLVFEPDHSVSSRNDYFNSDQIRAFQVRKKREWQQIQVLADRLLQDLSSLTLQSEQSGGQGAAQVNENLAVAQTLLADLQSAEPVGRLVIDLERLLAAAPGPPDDVILRGGDRLRIPKWSQEVTVIGEVQNSTSHLFEPVLTRDDYLRMSGGTTQKADDRRICVVAGQREHRERQRQPLVPPEPRVPARRHDRGAARREAHEAAVDVDGDNVDHLQPRSGGHGGEFVLGCWA
jgi:hypothetical protein